MGNRALAAALVVVWFAACMGGISPPSAVMPNGGAVFVVEYIGTIPGYVSLSCRKLGLEPTMNTTPVTGPTRWVLQMPPGTHCVPYVTNTQMFQYLTVNGDWQL